MLIWAMTNSYCFLGLDRKESLDARVGYPIGTYGLDAWNVDFTFYALVASFDSPALTAIAKIDRFAQMLVSVRIANSPFPIHNSQKPAVSTTSKGEPLTIA